MCSIAPTLYALNTLVEHTTSGKHTHAPTLYALNTLVEHTTSGEHTHASRRPGLFRVTVSGIVSFFVYFSV